MTSNSGPFGHFFTYSSSKKQTKGAPYNRSGQIRVYVVLCWAFLTDQYVDYL